MPKHKTILEREYHEIVGSLECVLCNMLGTAQTSRTTIHHARDGRGMSQRASHWQVAALCEECHQGPQGIHGDRALLRIAKASELDLVAITYQRAFEVAREVDRDTGN